MNNYTEFTAKQIDAAYINSLVELINACRANEVEIDEVWHYQNGFHVTFKGHKHADAICHDGSYGSPCPYYLNKNQHNNDWSRSGLWETMGFPWDYDDVSIHSAEQLADYLLALNHGEIIWEDNDEDC